MVSLQSFLVLCWLHFTHSIVGPSQRLDTRNIIFVGKSRSGKSTIIEVLQDADYDPPLFSIIRSTKHATMHSFTIETQMSSQLHLNVMDTPGLFERTTAINESRSNLVILELIEKCVETEIRDIHHVYFVMSIQQGLNSEDMKAFELLMDIFVGMQRDKISVLLSFAQDVVGNDEEEHYLNQFRVLPELKAIYERVTERIMFAGAAKKSSMLNMAALRQNVHRQRQLLVDHIVSQTTSFNITKLKLFQKHELPVSESPPAQIEPSLDDDFTLLILLFNLCISSLRDLEHEHSNIKHGGHMYEHSQPPPNIRHPNIREPEQSIQFPSHDKHSDIMHHQHSQPPENVMHLNNKEIATNGYRREKGGSSCSQRERIISEEEEDPQDLEEYNEPAMEDVSVPEPGNLQKQQGLREKRLVSKCVRRKRSRTEFEDEHQIRSNDNKLRKLNDGSRCIANDDNERTRHVNQQIKDGDGDDDFQMKN